MNYPNSFFFVVGDAGSRKSSFAATFPKPMLVIQMDARGKAMPYRMRGIQGKKGFMVTAPGMEEKGGRIPYELIIHPKDEKKLLVRIEHYQTADMQQGVDYVYGYENFMARFPGIKKEVEEGKYRTVVFDSLSSISYEARKLDEKKMNPAIEEGKKPHGKQVYGAAAVAIEELIRSNLASLDANVVLIGHLMQERTKEGEVTGKYLPSAPGQLPWQLPSAFPESYVMLVDENGETYLKTRSTDVYIATSQIPAPNPCAPSYKALWTNWQEQIILDEDEL